MPNLQACETWHEVFAHSHVSQCWTHNLDVVTRWAAPTDFSTAVPFSHVFPHVHPSVSIDREWLCAPVKAPFGCLHHCITVSDLGAACIWRGASACQGVLGDPHPDAPAT